IPAAKFGPGPGEFNVLAARGKGQQHSYIGSPVEIDIQPPTRLAAISNPGETKPGLKLTRDGQPPQIINKLANDWVAKAGIEPGQWFVLSGLLSAESAGLYQFQFELSGDLELRVDGQPQAQERFHRSTPGWLYYCPVNL